MRPRPKSVELFLPSVLRTHLHPPAKYTNPAGQPYTPLPAQATSPGGTPYIPARFMKTEEISGGKCTKLKSVLHFPSPVGVGRCGLESVCSTFQYSQFFLTGYEQCPILLSTLPSPALGCSAGEDPPADGDTSSSLRLLLLRPVHGSSHNDLSTLRGLVP